MKSKFVFILLFASFHIVNAQPTTGELIDAGISILFGPKKNATNQTQQQTAPQQTISVKTSPQEAPQSEPAQETQNIPAPTRKKSPDQPTDPKPIESPVVNTPVGEIDEMPDLASKKHDGVKYTVKQWQQIGQKVVIKMIIENNDANAPMKQIIVNGQENTIYDSGGNLYKGSITQVASFSSKGGESVTVPLVFGAKSVATVEFNVGNAKISKLVGLNFYVHISYQGNYYHFFTIAQ